MVFLFCTSPLICVYLMSKEDSKNYDLDEEPPYIRAIQLDKNNNIIYIEDIDGNTYYFENPISVQQLIDLDKSNQ